MYLLKQLPEDFVVKEISNADIKERGRYLYSKLIKKNRNTLDAIKEIAKQLHLQEKEIGFAGNKDKRAVTEQVISIKGMDKERVLKINIENITVEFLGYGDIPISLGDLEGNYFEIVARNLEEVSVQKIKYCENYFDEQRFSRNNTEIGKFLITKYFKKAIELIDNENVNKYLQKHKNDFVGALQELPIRLLRIYVNAYQSYLWNETLAKYLRTKGKVIKERPYSQGKFVFVDESEQYFNLEIPIIGFGSEEIDNGDSKDIIKGLMKQEGIKYTDFIIKQIPALTLEGKGRKALVEVKKLVIGKKESDDLNPGKQKVNIIFFLPKGSYATMVIKKIISE